MNRRVVLTPSLSIGEGEPVVFFAGPCVIESEDHLLKMADEVLRACSGTGAESRLVFKSSFDKANRSLGASFRGPGLRQGLRILSRVKQVFGIPVITDVHEPWQCAEVASVCDVLQIPAFLCRQTDLVQAAIGAGKPVLIKKGQFLGPHDTKHIIGKAQLENPLVMLCERGSSFGYHDLVVDFRNLPIMRTLGVPVIFDATHSTQTPGTSASGTGGERAHAFHLARAAAGVGVDGFFLEVHDNPPEAKSDSATQLFPRQFRRIVQETLALDAVRRAFPACADSAELRDYPRY